MRGTSFEMALKNKVNNFLEKTFVPYDLKATLSHDNATEFHVHKKPYLHTQKYKILLLKCRQTHMLI
jgi:hypothetical protein